MNDREHNESADELVVVTATPVAEAFAPDRERESKPSGEFRTAEQWAEAKGMLPQFVEKPAKVGRRLGAARVLNPKFGLYANAKAHGQWPIGKELSEADFDAAVAAAQNIESR